MILFLRPFNHISLSLIFTFAHMTDNSIAQKVVEHMMQNDRFSQWLGIECLVMQAGKSVIRLKVRDEMVNGFGIAHGGIAFSLADSALAFASNAYGRLSVALECSVSYPAPVHVGDELTATAEELSMTNRIGVYHITVTNQKNEKVAFFRGTVYRTSKEYFK
ncbi:MAG: Acyl-coenzyme A thioesterase PaaI [Bacteroidetes bacterium ADurb.Bin141]|nr:MAG: phenylacetic acid degradation protein PaaD [Bacteroidetes bacterium OLB10]OQB65768.1 MAG: Acyl-coenzyme A thioesterase PaaI [Bacteroidetes bacterium ADurb.Bin141]